MTEYRLYRPGEAGYRSLDVSEILGSLPSDFLPGTFVAIPTDTVYGLAARFDDPVGIEAIFLAKRRPREVSLPLLIDSIDQVASAIPEQQLEQLLRLGSEFWPGPLTVVVNIDDSICRYLGSTDGTVGLRIPDEPLLRGLLRVLGPLATTSANVHASPPIESADGLSVQLTGLEWDLGSSQLSRAGLAAVVQSERPLLGHSSTVLDVSFGRFRILREGPISEADLTSLLTQ